MHLKKSFMNLPFRCAVSALIASVPGGIIAIRTALAEESDAGIKAVEEVIDTSDAGTKVVEEVIDTVDATTAVANTVINNLPVLLVRVLTAGFILLIGVLAIIVGKYIINRLASRSNKKTNKIRKTETMRSILISLLRYLVSVIVVVSILTVFEVNVKSILAMASIGGIIVGFAMQTIIKDILYGTLILAEGSIGVGDFVRINDMDGFIDSVSLRTTVIRNYNGNVYTIPNGEIRTIANMSINLKRAIVDIRCPYEEDRNRLFNVISDEMETAVREIEGISGNAVIMNICAFEPDAMIFRIAVECQVKDHWRIEREIRARIKDRFDAEGIIMSHWLDHDFRYMSKSD